MNPSLQFIMTESGEYPAVLTSHIIADVRYKNVDEMKQEIVKVIIVGESGVGKTALAKRICFGCGQTASESTIGFDYRERGIIADGRLVQVQLWDTAGQERFRQSLVSQYYRGADAIVFVYDLSDSSTFANLGIWLTECRAQVPFKTLPRFLVANKTDKVPEAVAEENSIPAAMSEAAGPGRRFVARHSLDGFFAVSAKDSKNDAEFDDLLARVASAAVREQRRERGSTSPSPVESSDGSYYDTPALFGRRRRRHGDNSSLTNKIRLSGSTSLETSSITLKAEEVPDSKCC